MIKKFISFALAVFLVFNALVFTAYADDNISSGKNIYASSRYSGAHDPSNVLDGNEKTFWSTGSDTSSENLTGRVNNLHYIMIDLGEKYFVSKIVLKSRRDIDRPNERKGYTIEGSDDFNFSRSVILGTKDLAGDFSSGDFELLTDGGQSYRYIRITSKSTMSMSEFEVYGEVDTGDKVVEKKYADISDTDFAYLLTLMQKLGLVGGYSYTQFGENKLVTRGEAAAFVLRMLNGHLALADESLNLPYNDVEKTHKYYNEIKTLYANGFIAADESFRPNENIESVDFALLLIRALGYGKKAEAVKYPGGAAKVAGELGILKHLNSDSDNRVSRKEAVYAIFEALRTPVYDIYSVKNDTSYYEKGDEFLKVYHSLVLREGTVSENTVTDLVSYTGSNNSAVIGNKRLNDKNAYAFDFIGQNVYYLADSETEKDIFYVFPVEGESRVYTADCRDVVKAENKKIVVRDEDGSKKTYTLSDGVTVLKNNVASKNFTYDDFCTEGAYLNLVADETGKICVVKIYIPRYIALSFSGNDGSGSVVSDITYGAETLKIPDDSFVSVIKDGKRYGIEKLNGAGVVCAYISENKKCAVFDLNVKSAEGTVEEVGTDSSLVDGVLYGISPYFKNLSDKNQKLKPGVKMKFYINGKNEIVYVEKISANTENEKLCYIKKADFGEGRSDTIKLKAFAANGTYSYFTTQHSSSVSFISNAEASGFVNLVISDRVKINGESYTKTKFLKSFSEDYFTAKTALIKYDDEKTVISVYTEDCTDSEHTDFFKKQTAAKTAKYYTAKGGVYDNHTMLFPIKSTAPVFVIPTVDGKESSDDFYDRYYSLSTVSQTLKNNRDIGTCMFFGEDDFGYPSYAVKMVSYASSQREISNPLSGDGVPVVVKKTVKTLSDNEALVYRIYGINLNTGEEISADFVNDVEYIYDAYKIQHEKSEWLATYDFLDKTKLKENSAEAKNYLVSINDLKCGDILGLSLAGGRINAAERTFAYTNAPIENYTTKRGAFYNASMSSTSSAISGFRIQYGKTVLVKDNTVKMKSNSYLGENEVFDYNGLKIYLCENDSLKSVDTKDAAVYLDGNHIVLFSSNGSNKAVLVYIY